MKVAFNTLSLSNDNRFRGVGFYTKNLLEELKKRSDISVEEFENINGIKQVDIVHYPFFDLFRHTLPFKKRFPMIVTIHDVTPLVFPNHYPKGIKGIVNFNLQRASLKNVKAVITDSQASKKDIIKYLNFNSDIIFPIYLAPSKDFKDIRDSKVLSKIKEKYDLPEKFALYTGNINWNKNLLNIAEACKKADIVLVMIGSGFENKENLDHPEMDSYKKFLLQFENDPAIKVLGYVSTTDLVAIMNLSAILLLPSFYEGFGLPILEAQACQTPVITSNVSSMREIAGEGALFINPYDIQNISVAILKIITNTKLKNDLIKKGLENVNKFSWEKCADQTIQTYKKVVNNL